MDVFTDVVNKKYWIDKKGSENTAMARRFIFWINNRTNYSRTDTVSYKTKITMSKM